MFSNPFTSSARTVSAPQIISGSGGVPYILAAGAPAASITGSVVETALATVTIPANSLGPNGIIEVYSHWSYTNNANSKTLRVRFGGISGTMYFNGSVTTTATYRGMFFFQNKNATNSQIGAGSGNTIGGSSNAMVTSSVDTTAAADLVFSGLLASAADTIVLEQYFVRIVKI